MVIRRKRIEGFHIVRAGRSLFSTEIEDSSNGRYEVLTSRSPKYDIAHAAQTAALRNDRTGTHPFADSLAAVEAAIKSSGWTATVFSSNRIACTPPCNSL